MAVDSKSAANAAQIDKAIRQLEAKLARQRQAVSDTEAHIAALALLKVSAK